MFSITNTAILNSALRQCASRRSLTSHEVASLSTSSSAASSGRLVISRRAWQSFREKNAPPKSPKAPKPKEEEKPWPRSIVIGGTVAGAILIPYSFLWVVTSNPTLREWFSPYLPMNMLRTHYGHLEWDVQSYADEMMMTTTSMAKDGTTKKVVAEYYQFPNEEPYRVRQQQALIGALEGSDVSVTVYLSESDGHQVMESRVVSGGLKANEKTLIGLLKGSSKVSVDPSSSTTVAIDFDDDYNNSDPNSLYNEGFQTTPNTLAMSQPSSEGTSYEMAPASENAAAPLLQKTQSFSTWYHVPTQGGQQASGSSGASSSNDTEIEVSRLEYVIADLERNLKDHTCTRDIDEMMTELRRSKRELSALKWKRRLGLK
jgi:hypothetical protein